MKILKAALIVVMLSFCSSAFAEIDFENLKHCMASLRAPNANTLDRGVRPDSQFINTINWQNRENYEINALIFKEEINGETHVHVVQDVEANRTGLLAGMRNRLNNVTPNINRTYVFNTSRLAQQTCNEREPQSILALGGSCRDRGDGQCPMAKVGFGLTQVNGQTQFCPITTTFSEPQRSYQRELDLSSRQSEDIVRRAIVDQINFITEHHRSNRLQFDRNNVIQALSGKKYCQKAIQPEPVEIQAAGQILICQLAPLDRQVCQQGDVDPIDAPVIMNTTTD